MKLSIETLGDRSVGIWPGRVEIEFPGCLPNEFDKADRERAKEAFIEATKDFYGEDRIRFAVFEDECGECNSLLTECRCRHEDSF